MILLGRYILLAIVWLATSTVYAKVVLTASNPSNCQRQQGFFGNAVGVRGAVKPGEHTVYWLAHLGAEAARPTTVFGACRSNGLPTCCISPSKWTYNEAQ